MPSEPRYWSYGLCLTCTKPLKGLTPAPPESEPDLWVELDGEEGHEVALDPSAWRVLRKDPPCTAWAASSPAGPIFRLRYGLPSRHIEFTITHSGSRIRTRRTSTCTIGDVEALLLGPVLTCTLRARGASCLHASVVAIGDHAIALMGEAATGKSTTAAGLFRLGANPLADDLAVLAEREGQFLVHPGPRRLRLRSDVAAWLGAGSQLPRVWPDLPDRPERRYLEIQEEGIDFPAPTPKPLAAVYVLSARSSGTGRPVLECLPSARGFAALLSNAPASFMLPELGPQTEFHRLARLARAVPVRSLRRGEGIEHLDAVCHAIRDDVTALAPRSTPA